MYRMRILVATLDLEKKSITDKWKMENATANFPMALDSKNHRSFHRLPESRKITSHQQ